MGCRGFRFTLLQPRNQFSASGSGGHEAQPEMGDGTTPTLFMRSLRSPPRAWSLPDPSPPSVEKFLHAQWGLRSAASTGAARPCLPTQPFLGSSAAPHCALSEALVRLRRQAWPPLPHPPCPVALTVKGHVLDEAHVQGEALGQGHKVQEFVLVQASHHHAVHLVVGRGNREG